MKQILLCGGMVMLLANVAIAEPAGMVMYFQSGDEVYLLLAEHAVGVDRHDVDRAASTPGTVWARPSRSCPR